jgi:hypothetical protein
LLILPESDSLSEVSLLFNKDGSGTGSGAGFGSGFVDCRKTTQWKLFQ